MQVHVCDLATGDSDQRTLRYSHVTGAHPVTQPVECILLLRLMASCTYNERTARLTIALTRHS
eukprot:6949765-Prymnesium_polylepis.1